MTEIAKTKLRLDKNEVEVLAYYQGVWAAVQLPKESYFWTVYYVPTGEAASRRLSPEQARWLCDEYFKRWPLIDLTEDHCGPKWEEWRAEAVEIARQAESFKPDKPCRRYSVMITRDIEMIVWADNRVELTKACRAAIDSDFSNWEFKEEDKWRLHFNRTDELLKKGAPLLQLEEGDMVVEAGLIIEAKAARFKPVHLDPYLQPFADVDPDEAPPAKNTDLNPAEAQPAKEPDDKL